MVTMIFSFGVVLSRRVLGDDLGDGFFPFDLGMIFQSRHQTPNFKVTLKFADLNALAADIRVPLIHALRNLIHFAKPDFFRDERHQRVKGLDGIHPAGQHGFHAYAGRICAAAG